MKIRVVLFVICFCINSFSQTTVSPQFSELKGMEDKDGHTHLFYRIHSEQFEDQLHQSKHNSIYHLNVQQESDTLFLEDYLHFNSGIVTYQNIYNLDFWNDDPGKFIFCGDASFSLDYWSFVNRFDGRENILYYNSGAVETINISNQDDSLIYAGVLNFEPNSVIRKTIKSTDGGWNWDYVSDSLKFISLSPFDDKVMFLVNEIGMLYKSSDGGNSFHIADNRNIDHDYENILYDADQTYLYRLQSDSLNFKLLVSNNVGENGSWHEKYISESKICICIDENVSGSVFLAEGNTINLSPDYGEHFIPIASLESDVIGMYKNPDSNLLYIATEYRVYELDISLAGPLRIIKSITPATENYDWFPLSIGNYWVYEVYTSDSEGLHYWGDEIKTVVGLTTLDNGLDYFLYKYIYINGGSTIEYIRLDSLSGKLYALSFEEKRDLLYDDLSAEAGDTVCYEYNTAFNCQYVQFETEFSVFGLNTLKKEYYPEAPGWYFGHSFVKGIGLYQTYNGDLTTYSSTLKGCIIDGIVYGDTSVVTRVDKPHPVIYRYELEQNYPNPFNPTTTIRYKIPVSGLVTLKVFDVLGREVTTLVNEEKPAGIYEIEFDSHSGLSPLGEARNLTSGVYFYRLKAGRFIKTNKMIYLK